MKSLAFRLGMILALFLVNYLYSITAGDLNDYPLQYFLAGFAGVVTVWLVGMMGASPLVRDVQIIQTVFILLHCYGFIIYMLRLDPDTYFDMQIALEGFQILWILFARHDVRRYRLYNNGSDKLLHSNFNLRLPFYKETYQ